MRHQVSFTKRRSLMDVLSLSEKSHRSYDQYICNFVNSAFFSRVVISLVEQKYQEGREEVNMYWQSIT